MALIVKEVENSQVKRNTALDELEAMILGEIQRVSLPMKGGAIWLACAWGLRRRKRLQCAGGAFRRSQCESRASEVEASDGEDACEGSTVGEALVGV